MNYFFYDTSIKTGIDELSRYGKYFGLGRKTGIELTGEKQGTIAERSLGDKYNFVWSKVIQLTLQLVKVIITLLLYK